MDPISLSLAALTLTTAVKDLADIVQKLERSFSKPAENIRNVEILATEVRQTMDQLKRFCDEQEELLSKARGLKVALSELFRDMESVHEKCSGMGPVTARKKIDRFKATFGAWKNRNKVQSEIKELRNLVNRCRTQFLMFSIMGIEKLRDTLPTVPPEIQMSSDFISSAYLPLQIDTINALMEQLSLAASNPVEEPMGDYLLPFRRFPTKLFVEDDRSILREDVIMQVLQIQTILQGDLASLSVQVGARAFECLAVDLFYLEMYHESALIGAWAVKLFRTLVTNHPTTYLPYLALSLSNLANAYRGTDDSVDDAHSSIIESIAICRSLQTPSASLDIKLLLPHVLRISASMTSFGRLESLQKAEEAVLFFEHDVALQVARKSVDASDNSSSSTAHHYAQALHQLSPSTAVYDYAETLQQFSTCLQEVGQFAEAFQTQQRVLEIIDFLVPFYPDLVDILRARAFHQLLQPDFRDFLPPADVLQMAQELMAITSEVRWIGWDPNLSRKLEVWRNQELAEQLLATSKEHSVTEPENSTVYSLASSRTTSTDYGIYYTHREISRETILGVESVLSLATSQSWD
ncbi:hypothetical protein GALMADRAFT_145358 [Galerina marginata CBS 339.88]|uniref:Fungal N-terminal domain-containing protein n=1 Tax=Galerina marginata (strain CBS 339.88) TaxID=685588 RepID=A0A067SFD8_GALM3|nr:hypothetical protein GALMADRAFT_145358 [Galerina marginata CBS 339.88]